MVTSFKKITMLLPALVTAAFVASCGGGGSESSSSDSSNSNTSNGTPLAAQSGTRSALFYGNTNYQKLGSLTNSRVIDPVAPNTVIVSSDDITSTSTGRPQPSTSVLGYNTNDNSYTDLYVDNLYYVKAGSPKRVSMIFWHDMSTMTDYGPEETAHSIATGLTVPSYAEVNYLGTKRVLLATDSGGHKVIVCPSAGASEETIPFDNKTFLTFSFNSYGANPDGAVVYDTSTYQFQKMITPSAACPACSDPGTPLDWIPYTGGPTMTATSKYAFLGDILNTATSAVIIDGKLYVMDKATRTLTEKTINSTNTTATLPDLLGSTGKGVSKFVGDSAYYLYTGGDGITNLYRVNVLTGDLTQLTDGYGTANTNSSTKNIPPTKIHSATNDWVIYGTDGLMLAVKKSGNKASPTLLAENTKTFGIRYPFNFGIGDKYLFVTYSLNTTTGNTTYQACVFGADGVKSCKDNSFWAGVSAARQGKLNFTSDYPYTPYAFVRVDDTDNFGGGTIKAVDPTTPLDAGFAVGSVPTYNFNTFLHAYYYLKTTVDTDGYIVIYGKRDDNFVGDAFLLNLRQANSVKNLTNETPPSTAVANSLANDLHCHGRYCAICHNFAGGKLYNDTAGSDTAVTFGNNVKLVFQNGSEVFGRLGKGKGENFSFLYSDIAGKGTFTPVIVDNNHNVLKSAAQDGHNGLSYSNCDYCHARSGDTLRNGAPGVVTSATLP